MKPRRDVHGRIHLGQLLALVTLDDEVVGVLGRGFPTSFYRIHACIGGHWYDLESDVFETKRRGRMAHPIEADLRLKDRSVAMVWGQLRHILSGYQTCGGEAMEALLARGRELSAQKRAAWALHDAGVTPKGAA